MLELALLCPLIRSGIECVAPSDGSCAVPGPVLVVLSDDEGLPVLERYDGVVGQLVSVVLELVAVKCERGGHDLAGFRQVRDDDVERIKSVGHNPVLEVAVQFGLVCVYEEFWEDDGARKSAQGSRGEQACSNVHHDGRLGRW